jgi:hypothetical protein
MPDGIHSVCQWLIPTKVPIQRRMNSFHLKHELTDNAIKRFIDDYEATLRPMRDQTDESPDSGALAVRLFTSRRPCTRYCVVLYRADRICTARKQA